MQHGGGSRCAHINMHATSAQDTLPAGNMYTRGTGRQGRARMALGPGTETTRCETHALAGRLAYGKSRWPTPALSHPGLQVSRPPRSAGDWRGHPGTRPCVSERCRMPSQRCQRCSRMQMPGSFLSETLLPSVPRSVFADRATRRRRTSCFRSEVRGSRWDS